MALLCLVHGLRRIRQEPNREGDHLRQGPHKMGLTPHFHQIPGLVHHRPLPMRRLLHMKQHRQTCLCRRVQHPTAQADSLFLYKFHNIQEVQSV
jgi:hypothetical protein